MAATAKNKKWLGYFLYVVVVALALLYFLFPSQAVEDVIDRSIARVSPELGFTAGKIRPWLPPGLQVSDGAVNLSDTPGPPVFATESLSVKPAVLKLLRGGYDLEFSGRAYKGDIKGSLILEDKDGETLETELTFKDLDLGLYDFLKAKIQHRLSGMFSGDLAYTKSSGNTAGNGKAELRVTDGQLLFQNPIFNISSVDLQNINLELEMRNRYVTIVRGELSGQELNASLAGSIQLQPNLENSQVNLKGTIEPLAEFYRKYPEIRELLKNMKKRVKRGQYFFAVTGTIAQPRFRLL